MVASRATRAVDDAPAHRRPRPRSDDTVGVRLVRSPGCCSPAGASRRLGRDKAELVVDGERLADRGARVLGDGVGARCSRSGRATRDLPAVREEPAGNGPLAALAAGARGSWRDAAMTARCSCSRSTCRSSTSAARAGSPARPGGGVVVPVARRDGRSRAARGTARAALDDRARELARRRASDRCTALLAAMPVHEVEEAAWRGRRDRARARRRRHARRSRPVGPGTPSGSLGSMAERAVATGDDHALVCRWSRASARVRAARPARHRGADGDPGARPGPGAAARSPSRCARPGNDFELAVGFCLTEGVARVARRPRRGRLLPRRRGARRSTTSSRCALRAPRRPRGAPSAAFVANASCGLCGKTTLDQVEVRVRTRSVAGPVGRRGRCSWRCPTRLRDAQTVFDETGGLHAAARFDAARRARTCVREDVGRHNALDKVIGSAALARRAAARRRRCCWSRAG